MAETSKDVFRDLIEDIDRFGGRWTAYFAAVESAYAAAYKSQETLLSQTKARIEARKKQEDADRVFALSLLTAGMGGLIATDFSQRLEKITIRNLGDTVAAVERDRIVKQTMDKAVRAAKLGGKALKGASQGVQDWALKVSGIKSADISDGPYVPVAVTPAQYGADLRQGAQERVNVLNDIAFLFRDNADLFPLEVAKSMRSGFEAADFFTKAPASQTDPKVKDLLTTKAKLALWMAWALERDRKYWEVQSAVWMYNFSETHDWVDLRTELIGIGVPAGRVSFDFGGKYAAGALNMDGFIKWASSANAMTVLFAGLPQDSEGMKWVVSRWNKKLKIH